MKHFYLLFALALLCYACTETSSLELPLRAPIELIAADEADGEEKETSREEWEEAFHRAAPGTDWRKLEAYNAMARHRKRRNAPRQKGLEDFADGLLTGEWFERGSKFTSGSVFDVVQDPDDANTLFIMSAGGSIWQLNYTKEEYSLVNHDIFFDGEYLGLVPTEAGRNLLAYSNDIPMYSTDDGQNWEFADILREGNPINRDQVTNFFSPQIIGEVAYASLQINRGRYEVYHSTDGGKTYESFLSPPFEEVAGNLTITHLYSPPGTDRLFVLMKRMYDAPLVVLHELIETDNGEFDYREVASQSIETTDFYRARVAAAVQVDSGDLRIFIQADDQLFRSDDDGLNFREMPRLDRTPWRQQSIYVRPSDPDFVAWGAVELYVSRDGGETFEYPNRWFDYYDDPTRYLHADIMRVKEIEDPNGGGTQMLVSNHGGLNQLNPADSLWYSIAQEGLNVAQYYDVRTNPGNPLEVYAGSQDQGFQVLPDDGEGTEIMGGYQWFSGDYGHISFAEEGNIFFTAYPFGLVYGFYDVLEEGGNDLQFTRFELDSPDEFTWIAPMMSPPRADDRVVLYMAGGSADTARNGSFLVAVELDRDPESPTYGDMLPEDKPFDFLDAAAGNLTALTYSPINPQRFYAATSRGRFFSSDDEGEGWTETLNFLPSGWYLYGQAIHASKTEAETVWLGGSGYSNPPVWRSTDGGENFFPVSEGLPPTVVHGLTANASESLLFAATEAGPFVYVASEERWFDLAGQFAPTMRYYSVEFLEEENLARFGTYGRGAWDFRIDQLVATEAPLAGGENLSVYPNPAAGATTVAGNAAGYRLYDISGREVRRVTALGEQTRLSLAGITPGLYFLQPLNEQGRAIGLGQRLVVQ